MSRKQKLLDALALFLIVPGVYFLAMGGLFYVQGQGFDRVPDWSWIVFWCCIGTPMLTAGALLHVYVLLSRRKASGPNQRLHLTGNARG